jgi:hypothetical protein
MAEFCLALLSLFLMPDWANFLWRLWCRNLACK